MGWTSQIVDDGRPALDALRAAIDDAQGGVAADPGHRGRPVQLGRRRRPPLAGGPRWHRRGAVRHHLPPRRAPRRTGAGRQRPAAGQHAGGRRRGAPGAARRTRHVRRGRPPPRHHQRAARRPSSAAPRPRRRARAAHPARFGAGRRGRPHPSAGHRRAGRRLVRRGRPAARPPCANVPVDQPATIVHLPDRLRPTEHALLAVLAAAGRVHTIEASGGAAQQRHRRGASTPATPTRRSARWSASSSPRRATASRSSAWPWSGRWPTRMPGCSPSSSTPPASPGTAAPAPRCTSGWRHACCSTCSASTAVACAAPTCSPCSPTCRRATSVAGRFPQPGGSACRAPRASPREADWHGRLERLRARARRGRQPHRGRRRPGARRVRRRPARPARSAARAGGVVALGQRVRHAARPLVGRPTAHRRAPPGGARGATPSSRPRCAASPSSTGSTGPSRAPCSSTRWTPSWTPRPARVGRIGTGVQVGPLAFALGQSVDLMFVLGAAEGQLPSAPRADPLLGDGDRRLTDGALVTSDEGARPAAPPVRRRARGGRARPWSCVHAATCAPPPTASRRAGSPRSPAPTRERAVVRRRRGRRVLPGHCRAAPHPLARAPLPRRQHDRRPPVGRRRRLPPGAWAGDGPCPRVDGAHGLRRRPRRHPRAVTARRAPSPRVASRRGRPARTPTSCATCCTWRWSNTPTPSCASARPIRAPSSTTRSTGSTGG